MEQQTVGWGNRAAEIAEMLARPIEDVQEALLMYKGNEELAIDHLLAHPGFIARYVPHSLNDHFLQTEPLPKKHHGYFKKPQKPVARTRKGPFLSLKATCIEHVALNHQNYTKEDFKILTTEMR